MSAAIRATAGGSELEHLGDRVFDSERKAGSSQALSLLTGELSPEHWKVYASHGNGKGTHVLLDLFVRSV